MKAYLTTAVLVAVAMLTLAAATTASADSIYLKNGRIIRADDAHVDGARVIFFLHGAQQALPMALVDRIEDDDWRGPGAPPRPPDPSVLGGASNPVDRPSGSSNVEIERAEAGGLAALVPLLGALSGGGDGGPLGALGGLGSLGPELMEAQTILPALTRLGAALLAPEYSAAATDAAARELLQGLSKLGVSDAEIRARTRQFGLPEDILDQIGRR